MKSNQCKRIFISYSHDDRKWLDKLQPYLKQLELQSLATVFDDTKIRVGHKWDPKILKEIAAADFIILLVSENFLASEFIQDRELPLILERRASLTVEVIPILVSPCNFEVVGQLASLNFLNYKQPLLGAEEAEQAKIFNQLVKQIIPSNQTGRRTKANFFDEKVKSYLDGPMLLNQPSVKEFRKHIFEKVDEDPAYVLIKAFKMLEKFLANALPKATFKKGNSKSGITAKISPKIKAMISNIGRLQSTYTVNHPEHSEFAQVEHDAKNLSVLLLHILVWKYECLDKGHPELTPRSYVQLNVLQHVQITITNTLLQNTKPAQTFDEVDFIDSWGIATLRQEFRELTNSILEEAKRKAQRGEELNPGSNFNRLVSFYTHWFWDHSYKSSLKGILSNQRDRHKVGDWNIERLESYKEVESGLITANIEEKSIVIYLDETAMIKISNIESAYMPMVHEQLNQVGRLKLGKNNETAEDRLKTIDITIGEQDAKADFFMKNIDSLIPLLSTKGLTPLEWLLTEQLTAETEQIESSVNENSILALVSHKDTIK